MKILVDGMPRTTGGIGSLITNIAAYSRKCGDSDKYSFSFIIAGKSGYIPMLEKEGYEFFVAPPVRNTSEYKKFLSDLFAENSFDYLWFNNTSKVNIFLPECAKKHGVKIIAHPHGVDFEERGLKRVLFKTIDVINRRKMFSLIDIPFACSKEAADVYYRGNPELRNRATIINNGISVSDYTFSFEKRRIIRSEIGVSDDDYLLGAVGRLTAVKNYSFLISLLERLDAKYKLVIIGEGEEREKLQHLIDEKQLGNRCWLLGSKSNVPDYLSAMDCFLLPSFNEGFPFSIIEAQCEGLPCLSADTLSQRLKITDLVSFWPLNNQKQWIEQIHLLKKTSNRDEYVEEIIRAGYSIETSYQRIVNALK